jgi:hypothetical protein
MDEWLVAAGAAVPLMVALAFAVWFLVARCGRDRRERRTTRHVFRGQGEAITVQELLDDAADKGEPTRLNWPEDDFNNAGLMRLYVQDQFPTAIFPTIADSNDHDEL